MPESRVTAQGQGDFVSTDVHFSLTKARWGTLPNTCSQLMHERKAEETNLKQKQTTKLMRLQKEIYDIYQEVVHL